MVTLPPTLGLLRILPQTGQTSTTQTVQPATAQTGSQAYTSAHQGQNPLANVAAGTRFSGVITSQAGSGAHTLTLGSGQTLQVQPQGQQQLPVGTTVTIETTASGQIRIISLSVPAASQLQQLVGKYAGQWEQLDAVLAQLRQENPTLAKQLSSALPQPGQNFLGGLISFALGLQSGSLERLLGSPLHSQLAALGLSLDGDAPALHQLTQKQDGESPWRALFFPYHETDDQPPHQGSLFWRRKATKDGPQTRFVVNLALQSYGPVQVDGLLQKPTLQTKLRLAKALENPAEFEAGLSQIYTTALAPFDLSGAITVEITTQFNVDPLHEMLRPNPNVAVDV